MAETLERSVSMEIGEVAGPGGVRLFWREWSAGGKARTAMVLVHGAGEHSGRYGAFGEYFASRGVPVLAFDLEGLGQSGGTRGHVGSLGDYVAEVMFFRKMAGERHPDAGIVLVGHSMGGLIALATAIAHGEAWRAVVVSGPMLGLAVKVPGWKAGLGKLLAGLMPKLTMTNEIDPSVLSRNPEVGRRYAADPNVCKKVSAGWFVSMLRGMAETNASAGRLAIPTYILQGTDDKLVSPEAAKAFFDKLGDIPKSFRFMEGFYHELFQEDQREEVFELIKEWLNANGILRS